MDELQDVLKQHAMIMKATTALFYGILVSIAMNFFWEPGHIYSSGITGLAQLIGTLTKNGPVHLSTALMLFVLNIPLFVLGWRQIGHRFTLFTILAVFCSSVMIGADNQKAHRQKYRNNQSDFQFFHHSCRRGRFWLALCLLFGTQHFYQCARNGHGLHKAAKDAGHDCNHETKERN